MKKIALVCLLLLNFLPIFSMDVSVTHASFKGQPENYVEVYFYFVGRSLTQIQVDSTHSQATVEITVLFKQGEIVTKADKFNLKSPATIDPANFFEMQRIALPNGTYDIEVQMKDLHKAENKATYRSVFIVDYDDKNLRMSDISLLNNYRADSSDSKYTKNGYFMEPLPFQYYDRSATKLIFYNEVYNTDKTIGDDFLFSYSIEKANAKTDERAVLMGHKRRKAAPYLVNLMSMDIAQLESGNYKLITTIRNRNNDLLIKKELFFQRNNPLLNIKIDSLTSDALDKEFVANLDAKQLRYALKAVAMLIPDDETSIFKTIVDGTDTMAKKRYLFNYWAKKSPNMPEQAYDEHMMIARGVDKTYGNGFGYGFESDRGRVFLRYGRPDDIITVENENDAVPYEVWVYYKVERTQQTNIKFLFYNPDLIANGYRLLHTTCRGEVQNRQWKRVLYKNVPNEQIGNSIDGTEVRSGINRRAEQIFNDN
jgi:GWxTD domain-containing protein